ncbi:cytochrome P450 [Bailinhaonella thermotolerans]|uniref:cytochrome P450 n=1 Tax=Bailinhaonella thermotolerans TaxID=1070861 RepID=UPI00241369A4|nr:cytochrome P450 [Bailinhaonella thermotolerans]
MDAARPPGPRGHWLMGNVAEYERDRIGFLRRHHREFGDVFSFDERTVFTVDPRLAHQVLAATNREYVTEAAPFAGASAPRDAGEFAGPWMRARRALRGALGDDAAGEWDAAFLAALDAALGRTAGRPVDVLPVMLGLAAETVAGLCLGADAAEVPELLAVNHAALLPFEEASYQLPAWVPSRRNRRFFRAHGRMTEALTRIVAARRAGAARSGGRDLLGVLLDARPALSEREVTTTLWSLLIGGHGVPAAALTSLVRELALRPGLTAALASEAAQAAAAGEAPRNPGDPGAAESPESDGTPESAGTPGTPGAGEGCPRARLPLAEAVVREVLRLSPPAWMLTRVACVPAELGGWRLRPGDEVLLTAYLIHRDPRWWPRPDEFDPSRWDTAHPPPGAHLPFGSGPRYCPGSSVAMRQLTLAASRIAQRFHLDAPDAAATVPAFSGRLAPAGLRAAFRPRRPA